MLNTNQNIEALEIALLEVIEKLNSRTKKLDARIESTLSNVSTAAGDLRRIQMVNIEGSITGFRGLVIHHCLSGEKSNG